MKLKHIEGKGNVKLSDPSNRVNIPEVAGPWLESYDSYIVHRSFLLIAHPSS